VLPTVGPGVRDAPDAAIATRAQLVLRPGASLLRTGDGGLTLCYRDRPLVRVRGISPALTEALLDLPAVSGLTSHPHLVSELQQLPAAVRRCVLHGILVGDGVIAVAESLLADADRASPRPLRSDDIVRSSRFAYAHQQDDALLIESPDGGARIIGLDHRIGTVFAATAQALPVHEVEGRLRALLPAEKVRECLELMHGAGCLEIGVEVGGVVEFPSMIDPVLRQWEFHDLLFHARSRLGRTTEPFGGTFPYVGELEPEPAVRDRHQGEVVVLPVPVFEEILERDPAILLAMETRHSCRSFGEEPLTLAELSEFLFRSCRITDAYGPREGLPYAATRRPYPTGGAAYEIEVYVTVRRIQGLEPASYHYEPDTHRLRRLDAAAAHREALLEAASLSAGGGVRPDALLTLTSRFQRLQWKYRSIAYAVSLKHVGALYQTMYLVASAMQIGACGLGSGNSQTSVDAFGLEYLRESSVGEFIIGSAPATSRSTPADASGCAPSRFPGAAWGRQSAALRA
jgi:SagB-type dehydrogenase family enzyme